MDWQAKNRNTQRAGFDTRQAAYAHVQPTKQQTCDQIVALAIQRGHHGITADEVSALWECSPNHVAPRCTELKASGLLIESGCTRLTRASSPARVLVAKQFAPTQSRLFPDRSRSYRDPEEG